MDDRLILERRLAKRTWEEVNLALRLAKKSGTDFDRTDWITMSEFARGLRSAIFQCPCPLRH